MKPSIRKIIPGTGLQSGFMGDRGGNLYHIYRGKKRVARVLYLDGCPQWRMVQDFDDRLIGIVEDFLGDLPRHE